MRPLPLLLALLTLPALAAPTPGKKAPMSAPAPTSAPTPAPTPAPTLATETIYLAGGCFWGMEDLLAKIPGVLSTETGYTGGHLDHPRYDDTHDGKSGHAESVKVVFDPQLLTLKTLLEEHFFKLHDPTTENAQGNDLGTQYRSAIFYFSEAQRAVAEEVKQRVDASGKWERRVVTEIVPATRWWKAEEYHQAYLQKHPGGYSCHIYRK